MWQDDAHAVSPNPAEFFADPAGALQRSDIRLAPPTKSRLMLATGVLAIGLPFVLMLKFRAVMSWPILLGIGLGIAMVGLVVVAIRPFGVELTLTKAGVRMRRRATEVFCPWSLFNVSGNVLVRPDQLILPVATQAIPFVQQYQDERLVRQGVQVKTPLLRFQNGREVVLLPQFAVPAEDVGGLLLFLGRVLGHHLPGESVPAEAYPSTDAPEPTFSWERRNGWMTVSLTALKFPRVCCACGASADQLWSLWAGSQETEGLGGLTRSYQRITVRVPTCDPCLKEIERQQQRGRRVGAGIGLLVVLFGTAVVLPWRAAMGQTALLFFGAVAALIVTMAGVVIGAWVVDRQLPVRAARYSGSENTVALWFRQRAYADATRAVMENPASQGAVAALSSLI